MSIAVPAAAGDAQRRASDPEVSAWVAANAGSGKTHVLVNRVVRLLLAGSKPDRILCLTFTKAAASEMANRLFRRLGEWAVMDDEALARAISDMEGRRPPPDTLARARRLFARALETPGGLKIQTIHAFCESLLQRFPIEAGVAPGFEIVDARSTAEMIADVRAQMLQEAAAAPDGNLGRAIATAVDVLSEQTFDAIIGELIGRRNDFRAAVPATEVLAAAILRLRANLGLEENETPDTVMVEAAGLDAASRDAFAAARDALREGAATDARTAEAIDAVLAAPDPVRRFEALGAVFLTRSGEPRKRLMTKGLATAHPDLDAWLADEQARHMAAVERHRRAVTAAVTAALMTVADRILTGYEAVKSRHAALDYDDLIARTIGLFERSEAAWVLYKLDGGLDHILVDEAQDTSPDQWQVIRKLAEEFFAGAGGRDMVRTVFAVGDEKQSIFSFQGARPAEFERMRKHFEARVREAEQRFERVPLTVSFRSTRAVLEAVDTVFASPDAARGLGENADSIVHEAVRRGHAGLIEIWPPLVPDERAGEEDPWLPLDAESAVSPRLRLAARIAEHIDGWIRGGERLEARGRPVRPGDILILVRRRDAFSDAMVRALKQRGIPVAGADRLVLTRHIAVLDLLALARFVLLPEDDLTLAELLKSPLVARDDGGWIDDDDLFVLAHGRRGSLWQALGQAVDDGRGYGRAYRQLRDWRHRAGFAAPFEFFSRALGADGGRRRFYARLGAEAGDPLDEFLALALAYEHQHTPSLAGFLHWVASAETEIKRDMEHGRDEVRIMTVHGAKGLEANIVFLPDTCAAPTARHDPSILFVEPIRAGDALPPMPVWAARRANDTDAMASARAGLEAERREEYHRLLYVAMTRARDRLYVCGYEGLRGRGEGCWYDLVTHALEPKAETVTGPDGETVLRLRGEQAAEPYDAETAGEAAVARADPPAWARGPAPAEPPVTRPLAPSRLEAVEAAGAVTPGDSQPVASPLAPDGEARFRRGRLVHRLLQVLPGIDPPDRAGQARRFLAAQGAGLDHGAIVAEVMAILDHPDFAALFGPGSRAEVPLAGALPLAGPDGRPVVISGQVDRLVVTEAAVMVVDYKTNRPPPVTVADVAPLYLRQMAAYRLALGRIFPGRAIRCLLLWTDGPRLMELPADLLDGALAPAADPA